MAIERIPCGGWDIDNTTIAFVKTGKKKVLGVIAGSQSGPSKLPLIGGTMLGPIELEEGAQPIEPNHVVDKQYVDNAVTNSLTSYRVRDLFGIGTNDKLTVVLPVVRQNVAVVFYTVDTSGNVNVSNSKAFAVAAGNTDNVNSFSVEFNADGRTITMNNNSSTETVLGQYFGYNQ